MQIDVDFDVYKLLTARRESEHHSYSDVLRELLKLPPTLTHSVSRALRGGSLSSEKRGFPLRGGELPNGTRLRATYKGRAYAAEISAGEWRDSDGNIQSSPSAAASAISRTNVNGLRFWHAKRPDDPAWTRLDILLALGT